MARNVTFATEIIERNHNESVPDVTALATSAESLKVTNRKRV